MENKKDIRLFVISYLTLRKSVGVLGMALPFILAIGYFILDKDFRILNSISTYYHYHIGNALVGILCGFALFLFAYRGHDKRDNIAGHLGCIFALGIAFFPNSPNDPGTLLNILHLISATSFFSVLIYFSLVLFTQSDKPKPYTKAKRNRNKVYYFCGYTMLGCILTIAVYMLWIKGNSTRIDNLEPVFWLESLALFAFGFSWLTKGQAIFKDTVVN